MARLETHILVRRLACRAFKHAQLVGTFFALPFIPPCPGYSCMRKANPARVGWGGGECSCICGLLARFSAVGRTRDAEEMRGGDADCS